MDVIVFESIEVDGNVVQINGSIEIEKVEAKVRLIVTLKQKYENMLFKLNDASKIPEFDAKGVIAIFNDFPIIKDGSLLVKIVAKADGYTDCEAMITVNHRTPSQSVQYISGGIINVWDPKDKDNQDIDFQVGEHNLEVSIYYEEELLETSHFIITRV